MIEVLLALAYPVYCMVILYVVLLSCDDHQFNWWEQMGEVPEVSKEVEILLHSLRGLVVISAWVHLGLWPMYLFVISFMHSS